jgi:hypothetical protein
VPEIMKGWIHEFFPKYKDEKFCHLSIMLSEKISSTNTFLIWGNKDFYK